MTISNDLNSKIVSFVKFEAPISAGLLAAGVGALILGASVPVIVIGAQVAIAIAVLGLILAGLLLLGLGFQKLSVLAANCITEKHQAQTAQVS